MLDRQAPVLVTGASGYLASWIVYYLLEAGYTVHGTVRDQNDLVKVGHLKDLQNQFPRKLQLFTADLMVEDSFTEAMQRCEIVIHTACPFKNTARDPDEELINPSEQGTINVLTSVNATQSVRKVILTSSVAAIFCDAIEIQEKANPVDRDTALSQLYGVPSADYPVPGKQDTDASSAAALSSGGAPSVTAFDEHDWNLTAEHSYQPYQYAKTKAEKRAWSMFQDQERWQLITLQPGFALGPSCSSRLDSVSYRLPLDMISGLYRFGVMDMHFAFVDVRDAARAHIKAAERCQESGRVAIVSTCSGVQELASIMRDYLDRYPQLRRHKKKLSARRLNRMLLYLIAPLAGLEWKQLHNNLGIPIRFDNRKSKRLLDMDYIHLQKTVTDHMDDLRDKGLLK